MVAVASRLMTLGPLLLCFLAVKLESGILMAAMVAALFLLLKFLPHARGRESITMFLMVSTGFFPANLWFLDSKWVTALLDVYTPISRFLFCLLIYGFLFSIQQLVLGVLTRLIWARQKKSFFHIVWEDCV